MNPSVLTFALGAGLVAALNPCGFALLPGYLALVISGNTEASSRLIVVGRAAAATAVMAAGFVTVFGVFGLAIAPVVASAHQVLPYATIGIGVVLLCVGIWLLLGRELTMAMPRLFTGTPTASLGSMYAYGLAYAIASLSCTVAPFLAVISTTFRQGSVVSGMLAFLAYGAGMTITVGVAALAVALLGNSATRVLRKVLPYVGRIAGAIVAVTALYVIYYGYYEIRMSSGNGDAHDLVVGTVVAIQGWLAQQVEQIGAWPLIAAVVAIIVMTVGLTIAANSIRRDGDDR